MKEYVGVNMAFWHSYKKMSELIWSLGLLDYFGPIFHEICPRNLLKVKPPLRIITTFFLYLMMAYGEFKLELDAGCKDKRLALNVRTKLLNLQDLCEFFIPVVGIIIRSLLCQYK